MALAASMYSWQDRLADMTARPVRFALWMLVFALAFAAGRFWLFAAVAVYAFYRGIKTRKDGGGRLLFFVCTLSILFFTAHLFSFSQSRKIEEFVSLNTPVNVANIPNGSYQGEGTGINGDVAVTVTVKDGAIEALSVDKSREPVYAFDDAVAALIGSKTTDLSGEAGFVFRNRDSLAGFEAAVNNALLTTLPDYPKTGVLTAATFYFTSNRMGRIFLNTLAILFIAIITFDFFLQPALARGTGQSLNCYNCQACVGVCPVKMVAGDPFPMIMVVEARAGNYDKVAQLAKYCVGCGKCASKCPVGNSGPSVASSSYLLWKQDIQREKRREMARLRQWPTLDQLEQQQEGDHE